MQYVPSVAAIFAAVCVVVAPPAIANPGVPQGKIDTLLLSDDDVSSIVGLPMHRFGEIFPSPGLPGSSGDHNECRRFVSSDVDMWSGEFTAFRQVAQEDNPDDLQFAVKQYVAVFPDFKVAAQTFRHGFPPELVNRCGAATLTDSGGTLWNVGGISITGSRATWTVAQLQDGQDTTWHCANDVQEKGNVMLQDQECQFGNGRPVAAQLASLTASRIPS